MEPSLDLHTPLTSDAFQDRFPDAYRALFASCETVVSVPLAVSLTGDRRLATEPETLMLRLPRRLWVGAERVRHGTAARMTVTEYDDGKASFVPAAAGFRTRAERILLEPAFDGHALTVLAETQDGRSMTVPGALAAACALLAAALANVVDRDTLAAWEAMGTDRREADPRFAALLSDGARFQHPLRHGAVYGCSALAALSPGIVQHIRSDGRPRTIHDFTIGAERPMDLALLGAGSRDELGDLPVRHADPAVADAAAVLHAHAFNRLAGAWKALWMGTGTQAEVLIALRARTSLMRAVEALHPDLEDLLDGLAVPRWSALPLGVAHRAGSVLLASAAFEERSEIGKGISRTGASLLYASWRDAGSERGAAIEQDLEHGLVGRFVPIGAARITFLLGDGRTRQLVSSSVPTADIVADARTGRVLIGGTPVHAGELPTQRGVCVVLQLLARSAEVSSGALPRSSYASMRSEFVSKVAAPLARTVEERTGKRIRLSTSGGAGDFRIRLDAGDATVAVTEAIS